MLDFHEWKILADRVMLLVEEEGLVEVVRRLISSHVLFW